MEIERNKNYTIINKKLVELELKDVPVGNVFMRVDAPPPGIPAKPRYVFYYKRGEEGKKDCLCYQWGTEEKFANPKKVMEELKLIDSQNDWEEWVKYQ